MCKTKRPSAWQRALELSAATPETRNRYVDLLRAVSILFVIYGHWIAAAAYADGQGGLVTTHLLALTTTSHPFTWIIQVMPVFFFVGGFSNGVSWSAAQRKGSAYSTWLESRLRRLVGPVLIPLVVWIVMGAIANRSGVTPPWIGRGSQMALIPVWFLAVYVLIALLVPISHGLWKRFGMGSIVGLAAIAALVDVAFFQWGLGNGAWVNYIFVWSAVHQLGYAWCDGKLEGSGRPLGLAILGAVALGCMIHFGPYPLSMVGVPGDEFSNTMPPKISLLALGCLQVGLLLSIQEPMKRWLRGLRPWAATVLINSMIMTLFLWHMTVMILSVGAGHLLGDLGLKVEPNSGAWWAQKAVWLLVCTAGMLPAVAIFARFERPKALPKDASILAPWRLVVGAHLVVFGLAAVAYGGIAGDYPLGLNWPTLIPPFIGAALVRRWKSNAAE
ncbi:MAG: acyltransferase [Planctomycetota bacterium]|nr:acyltransferase [Planctomycetota bacterium]